MLLTVLITLTFSRNAKSIVSITVILLVLVGLALLWHNISQTRQLIYRAENDELTICKLTPFLTWQPENVYPASHFIGISIELGELWLIGKNEQADIYLGKSSGLTESRTERTYRVAKQIHQATGLPILVRKDIQEA